MVFWKCPLTLRFADILGSLRTVLPPAAVSISVTLDDLRLKPFRAAPALWRPAALRSVDGRQHICDNRLSHLLRLVCSQPVDCFGGLCSHAVRPSCVNFL